MYPSLYLEKLNNAKLPELRQICKELGLKSGGLKQDVIIETVFSINAYPTENMSASNLIYEYLKDNNLLDKVAFEELVPFEIKTKSWSRKSDLN